MYLRDYHEAICSLFCGEAKYKSAPIGYGIDWAVTDSGETLLMELNDGFSLGNYGCRGHHYTAVIEARWRQFMGMEDTVAAISCLSVYAR